MPSVEEIQRGIEQAIFHEHPDWSHVIAHGPCTRTDFPCEHKDSWGSTIIVGPGPLNNEGPPVCILCDKRFPHYPLEVIK